MCGSAWSRAPRAVSKRWPLLALLLSAALPWPLPHGKQSVRPSETVSPAQALAAVFEVHGICSPVSEVMKCESTHFFAPW